LELDGSMGEAHATLAMLKWWHEWDWAAAEREFNLALELAPSYAWGHSSRSGFLAWSGRRAEALAEIGKARELDPGYSSAACESADYFQLRDYERLMEVSRRGIVSDPNEWLEPYFLGVAYEGLGRRPEAIPEYQKAIELSKGDQDPVAALAHAYAVVGRRTEAETMLRDLQRRSSEGYVSPYLIATIYAGLDNKDKAFEFLEKARQERSWDIAWQIKADPRIDNLRSDPRFQALLRRVGVSQ
jgi:tetratricopeptide (TPR) repeat protein